MNKMMKRRLVQLILVLVIAGTMVTPASTLIAEADNQKTKNDESNAFGYKTYKKASSYSELVSWYKELESRYPNYIEVFKANKLYGTGTVEGGYDCYYVRITNESLGFHKPEVLFLGGPHGDETVGTNCLYWFVDWLMRMAFTDLPCPDYDKEWLRWLIDHREIYIEVSHNPYGFDHHQRYDAHGWDLNREADYDGPGSPTGGIWASVPGKTLYHFLNDHLIRVGCDFHGGARMLLYPWSSNHDNVYGTSPITGKTYSHAPPDFYFYDACSLRLGDYMGDYGGDLNENNIGTIPDTVGYEAPGAIAPWAYGADVVSNPVEDPYVQDEVFGNYPGAGVLWLSPEMSTIKDPPEDTLGGDLDPKYGAEVRRFLLHQIDIAQPYVRWVGETPDEEGWVLPGTNITFQWQVNGSLVVDHTYIQWGTNPDPIHHPQFSTPDHDEHAGQYYGGTGWDGANDGQTDGVVYTEVIRLDEPGDYYFVAKAQVDQIYKNVLHPDVYGDKPYLRIIKERTDPNYHEEIEGADGTEVINGQLWWYSPIIHIAVGEDHNPPTTRIEINGPRGNDDWYIGLTVVELHASDDLSGVNYTMYRVNNGEWTVYDRPFMVEEGTVTVEYYSVDYAGNVEETKSYTFKYDKTKPSTTCVVSGEQGMGNWYRSDVTITFSATDNVSGVNVTWYRIDGGDWRIYDGEGITLSGEGRHIIEYYSTDIAGNLEDTRAKVIYIDYTPPSLEILYPSGGETLSGEVTVRWNSSDNLSPDTFVSIEWSIDGEKWYSIISDTGDNGTYVWDTTRLFDGNYMLRITVKDFAGNIASKTTSRFTLDNGIPPPEINLRFVNPEKGGIYIFGNRFLPLPGSVIIVIGRIDIEVRATINSDIVYIDHVDFYLDDELQCTVSSEPYVWSWRGIAFGKHTVKVVAHDILGNSKSAELSVWRLL